MYATVASVFGSPGTAEVPSSLVAPSMERSLATSGMLLPIDTVDELTHSLGHLEFEISAGTDSTSDREFSFEDASNDFEPRAPAMKRSSAMSGLDLFAIPMCRVSANSEFDASEIIAPSMSRSSACSGLNLFAPVMARSLACSGFNIIAPAMERTLATSGEEIFAPAMERALTGSGYDASELCAPLMARSLAESGLELIAPPMSRTFAESGSPSASEVSSPSTPSDSMDYIFSPRAHETEEPVSFHDMTCAPPPSPAVGVPASTELDWAAFEAKWHNFD